MIEAAADDQYCYYPLVLQYQSSKTNSVAVDLLLLLLSVVVVMEKEPVVVVVAMVVVKKARFGTRLRHVHRLLVLWKAGSYDSYCLCSCKGRLMSVPFAVVAEVVPGAMDTAAAAAGLDDDEDSVEIQKQVQLHNDTEHAAVVDAAAADVVL
jgi:hypothetical protein